ncbi:MAG TPA: hypothetical protein PKO39_06520 [Bacilli bacterium]|jgi:hypothetical protein|nr:hypothetical protein [Acholeplasmataceae bacterium]HOA79088.1 hypothetical protein [Bacilli bacterium]HPZ27821.1 hypothetical protein [Bacilli bacterium]HQC90156.1 hypothetical protein [Bacilli bacterium]
MKKRRRDVSGQTGAVYGTRIITGINRAIERAPSDAGKRKPVAARPDIERLFMEGITIAKEIVSRI